MPPLVFYCIIASAIPSQHIHERHQNMQLLDRVRYHCQERPDTPALIGSTNPGKSVTFGQLWSYSSSIAAYLHETLPVNNDPVIVYGHKSPLMLASFLGCMRSGHAYVPIDAYSVPKERVASIAGQIREKAGNVAVLASLPLPESAEGSLDVLLTPPP